MEPIQFLVEGRSERQTLRLAPKGVLLWGYTGRDQAAVRKHIEELEKEGIAPPPSVPACFQKTAGGITTADRLEVVSPETSGEIEFVLLVEGEEIYVGVGSDHTDRALEKLDILKSKQVNPAPVSKSLWKFREIEGHWDEIEIRSWATVEGEEVLYQQATLGSILTPDALLGLSRERVSGPLDRIALFSGTPALQTGGFVFAEHFKGELYDPVFDRRLTVAYAIEGLDWFRG